jgi:hypothetical protein
MIGRVPNEIFYRRWNINLFWPEGLLIKLPRLGLGRDDAG